MTEELQELGLKIGHRRIGRLMRENDIKIVRTQKYKATTDSNHTFNTEKDSKIKNTFRNKNQRGALVVRDYLYLPLFQRAQSHS